MAAPVVAVVGLKALEKDMIGLTADTRSRLYKAIVAAGKEAVAPVAAATRSEIPHASGSLAGTVRSSGTRTGANVRYGSARSPYAGWVEFGGTRPQGPSDRSARPYTPRGRYLFPAAEHLADKAARLYSDALGRVFDDASTWTNTGPGNIRD